MFALPLQVGGVHAGVMDLYRRLPGKLDRKQLVDALLLADTACALLLDSGRPGLRAEGLHPEQAGPHHPEVHQATGLVTAHLGVPTAVALVRLRAYANAYANDCRLRDVVARRLRFDPDPDSDGP